MNHFDRRLEELGNLHVRYAEDILIKLRFEQVCGDLTKNWLILRKGETMIGLFQGMLEQNTFTFNSGKTNQAETLNIGPASFTLINPDGNPILIDQHVAFLFNKKDKILSNNTGKTY